MKFQTQQLKGVILQKMHINTMQFNLILKSTKHLVASLQKESELATIIDIQKMLMSILCEMLDIASMSYNNVYV